MVRDRLRRLSRQVCLCDVIHFKPVERHIHDRAQVRLCDGRPAGPADISSEAIFELRDARRAATLRPDCQDEVHPRDVRSDLYGMGRHSTAHLYSVPVLGIRCREELPVLPAQYR